MALLTPLPPSLYKIETIDPIHQIEIGFNKGVLNGTSLLDQFYNKTIAMNPLLTKIMFEKTNGEYSISAIAKDGRNWSETFKRGASLNYLARLSVVDFWRRSEMRLILDFIDVVGRLVEEHDANGVEVIWL
jgi:hypothetical protein